MLWVDKHRPSSLDELTYHDSVTERLRALASNPASLPHLFFYGPSGAGKRTRVLSLLKELFGKGALKLKLDKRTFTTPTKKTVDINMISSNYHIEICPADAGLNDRFVIQEVIKEMASNKSIHTAMPTMSAGATTNNDNSNNNSGDGPSGAAAPSAGFKVVILSEVDRLSKQAQAALRRTMERYAQTCRLILVSSSAAKVMEPVRSRCLGIRIGAPTAEQVSSDDGTTMARVMLYVSVNLY